MATIVDSGFCHSVHGHQQSCVRELCGFVHGDDFIIAGDSVTLAWIESRINKGVILMRRAIPGRGDGDDKTVTILNRFVS